MNIERRAEQYKKARKRAERAHPGCKVSVNSTGQYFIENAEGQNITALRYPTLAFSDDVYTAYINLDIASHWNKTEDRNSRKFRNDKNSVCVVGDASVTTSERIEDYIDNIPDWETSDGQPED
jgi:hypothetical protein